MNITEQLRQRQAALRNSYRQNPALARVTDHASTGSVGLQEPFHGEVRVGGGPTVPFGFAVHHALGGPHDAPCPGDLLCAAIASCQEASLRMVATGLQVDITELQVHARGDVDVRGVLGMDPTVPVGFQSFAVDVRLRVVPSTEPQRLVQLTRTAERSCVVIQTLNRCVPVKVTFDAAVLPVG